MKSATNFRLESNTLTLLSQLAEQLETTRTGVVEQAINSYAQSRLKKHSRLMSFAGTLDNDEAEALLTNIRSTRRNKIRDIAE